jgi:hypothetical protein
MVGAEILSLPGTFGDAADRFGALIALATRVNTILLARRV